MKLAASVAAVACAILAALVFRQTTDVEREPEALSIQRIHPPLSDREVAIRHLSQALTFPTIASPSAPNSVPDAEPFREFHAWLEGAYPLVFERLKLERVGGRCLSCRAGLGAK